MNNPPYVGSTEFDYGNLSKITGGLQTHLRRRAGQVTFMGAFTWSKNLGSTSSDTSNDLDYMNYHLMYGPVYSSSSAGSMDIEKVFVGTFVWRMPTLRNHSAFIRGPIGGWQLSGVTHLQSGP